MSIRLDESTRAIWFITLVPNEQDFLASVSENEDGLAELAFRFRYHHSDDPFDEQDEKKWEYRVSKDPAPIAIEKFRQVTRDLAQTAGALERGDFYELMRGDKTLNEFMAEFLKQPFVHARVLNDGSQIPS